MRKLTLFITLFTSINHTAQTQVAYLSGSFTSQSKESTNQLGFRSESKEHSFDVHAGFFLKENFGMGLTYLKGFEESASFKRISGADTFDYKEINKITYRGINARYYWEINPTFRAFVHADLTIGKGSESLQKYTYNTNTTGLVYNTTDAHSFRTRMGMAVFLSENIALELEIPLYAVGKRIVNNQDGSKEEYKSTSSAISDFDIRDIQLGFAYYFYY